MILQQLKSCYQIPNQTTQFLNSAENNTVRNFLTGLKSDIYTRIYLRDPITLNHAIESAIKAETEYNEHAQRIRITEGLMQSIRCNNCLGYGHHAQTCSTINPFAQVSRGQWQPKVCIFCKNTGHTRTKCRALQPRILTRNPIRNTMTGNANFINNRLNQPTSITPRNNELICRYARECAW